ncbi:MAG: hypothetical protein O8C64_05660 [Candidatus Methanoperedens sp.]|nr:hypothetical protein [Candidatus Methanoperedens sp.]
MEITEKIFEFTDEIGPEKIVHLYEPRTKMKAIVVVDNVAAGPAIGGVRMAPDVTTTEVRRLGREIGDYSRPENRKQGTANQDFCPRNKKPPGIYPRSGYGHR